MVFGRGAFGRLVGYEGEVFINGISALTRKSQEAGWFSVYHVRIHGKVGPGTGSLPEPGHAGRLPASKTVRNKYLFFINH